MHIFEIFHKQRFLSFYTHHTRFEFSFILVIRKGMQSCTEQRVLPTLERTDFIRQGLRALHIYPYFSYAYMGFDLFITVMDLYIPT